jgi:tripartite-type tricarboxylate transporter receptor subunit TctC
MRSPSIVARILTTLVLFALAATAAAQQPYPSKPIRLITPYPPGGGTTVVARLLGQKLTESWGQYVIVDNRPGGNTIIGTEAAAKAPPDGYTLVLQVSTFVIVPSLIATPYDPVKNFAPIANLAKSDYVLVVHPSIPANDLKELIALAKARPGKLNYGSTGTGGVQHLAGESLNIIAGIKMQHIPYKGSGQLLPDLFGGQIQVAFQVPISAIAYIKSGKLKGIAIGGDQRLPALPQVPTFAEAGLPGFEVNTWFGILAPAGTPRAIVDKLSTGIAKILSLPDTRKKLDNLGLTPFFSTPEQFAALIKADAANYAKIIKTADIKGE